LLQELVLENLKHRPLRTLLSVIAIGVEVTLILTIVGISRGMTGDIATRIRGTNADIMVKGPGAAVVGTGSVASLPEQVVDFFGSQPKVRAAAGSLMHGVGGFTTITGVDFPKYEEVCGGIRLIEGRKPRAKNEILIDPSFARQSKKKLGDKVTFVNNEFVVVGVMESGQLAQVLVDLRFLQEITETKRISQVMMRLKDPRDTDEVVKGLRERPELKGYLVMSIADFASFFAPENVPGLKPFINVVIGIALVIGFLTVSLTMYTAVLERTREIGILKSLGASPAFIMQLLMRESLFLAVLGTVAGIAFTFGAKVAIEFLVPASLKQEIVFDWWPVALVVSIAGALAGTVYPGMRAVRQDAIEALSYE
jgi:putative ABC transport system permease protein